MNEKSPNKPVFIFDTRGDWYATKIGNFIFSPRGEYVAYLEGDDVYKRDGEWIGNLSKDGRILRKRTVRRRDLHPSPPPAPPRPEKLPPRAPLPPMMAELSYSMVDVLDEDPDTFKKISDLRPDMD
ncbi:MAG: hypothetical protein JW966_02085 [Anaerolineae bacterium]|nr:hypothetical protein [Anaerolineae bacterium]